MGKDIASKTTAHHRCIAQNYRHAGADEGGIIGHRRLAVRFRPRMHSLRVVRALCVVHGWTDQ